MKKHERIEMFVQKILGCGCPGEVFDYVYSESNIHLDNLILRKRINIGNKLLIFIVKLDNTDLLNKSLELLIEAGKKERDESRFNRFRLVIVADNPDMLKRQAFDIFETIGKDERVHLHIVHKDKIKEL